MARADSRHKHLTALFCREEIQPVERLVGSVGRARQLVDQSQEPVPMRIESPLVIITLICVEIEPEVCGRAAHLQSEHEVFDAGAS